MAVLQHSDMGGDLGTEQPRGVRAQLEVCKEQVEWARGEKRTFLRQRIEARLATLYLGAKDYPAALALISRLLVEARPVLEPKATPIRRTWGLPGRAGAHQPPASRGAARSRT